MCFTIPFWAARPGLRSRLDRSGATWNLIGSARRIRVLGLVILACFVLLFVQLNNLQIREAPSLRANPDNPSQNPVASWYQNPRGELLASDGTVLAESVHTAQGYERDYPDGPLYADVTGYYDATAESTTGLDDEYDRYLTEISHQARASKGF